MDTIKPDITAVFCHQNKDFEWAKCQTLVNITDFNIKSWLWNFHNHSYGYNYKNVWSVSMLLVPS